ncbi:LVIVD repeat-containing protein [Streptoalloteichus hindustanus]|uniref:LVIVD repeat-containing protein n=1 Tax=Streptoalloteichus hindustanus TaxID=2017 RepID=A0A1M5Q9J2_STRHI|nr:hypothetical protein [Streptoalloteichus hindustanus]SHH10449.1 LVIVD repeat-containing protein [Streptoalloteichus hindustanus]
MSRTRWAGRRRGVFAVVGAAALGVALLTPPASAGPEDNADIPGVDQVSSSRNMRQLANIPKQAPFDNTNAYGTDIAFADNHAFVGNYDGFVVYDVSRPRRPKIVSQVHCPGGQNDISVHGNLLFLSTDYPRSNNTCASEARTAADADAWEGIKVFDISDKSNPRYVAAVDTKCGSHTHTLVPDRTGESVYLYVSSYSPRPNFPKCQPPHDQISIVKVPLRQPERAAVVAEPVLFPDGGNPGQPGQFPARYVTETTGCHDITVYPEKDLAAGACMGDGVLMDISDRERPRVFERVRDDRNFAFWHSATFNNAGTKVVFTDELGGGGAPTCDAKTGPERGADGIYDIVGQGDQRKLVFRSYFKIPRPQAETENCVAHNGSLIPVRGRDIMVQAWYQGGVSVWDFTDSARPKEIGYWERGPLTTDKKITGGSWSAYYYNGHIYSSDIQKGLDVLDLTDPRTLGAKLVRVDELNVQTQGSYRG